MGRVTTSPVTTTFGYLFQPKITNEKDAAGNPVQKQKWQITPLFHADNPEDAASLQECINDAYAVGLEEFGEHFWTMVQQRSIRWPFRDGGEINPKTGQPRFGEGITFVNCSSHTAPDVVSLYYDPADPEKKPRRITDPSEYYWGQKARLNITFKAYKRQDGSGIAAYINGVQLCHTGDRLGEGQFDARESFNAEGAPTAEYAGPATAAEAPPAAAPPAAAPPAAAPPAAAPPAVGGPPPVGGNRLL